VNGTARISGALSSRLRGTPALTIQPNGNITTTGSLQFADGPYRVLHRES
jgi:hypothetical protein